MAANSQSGSVPTSAMDGREEAGTGHEPVSCQTQANVNSTEKEGGDLRGQGSEAHADVAIIDGRQAHLSTTGAGAGTIFASGVSHLAVHNQAMGEDVHMDNGSRYDSSATELGLGTFQRFTATQLARAHGGHGANRPVGAAPIPIVTDRCCVHV